MCGIAGFIGWKENWSNATRTLHSMRKELNHRGPDSNGYWVSKSLNVFFGHSRLAVIDLSSAAHQPMSSSCGRYIIVYNGEIYNHLEIRKFLTSKYPSIIWKSYSDTETLITSVSWLGLKKTLNLIQQPSPYLQV